MNLGARLPAAMKSRVLTVATIPVRHNWDRGAAPFGARYGALVLLGSAWIGRRRAK